MKNKKTLRKGAIRKSSHEILKEDSMEEENEKMIKDESEKENIEEEQVDEIDLGDDNGHLEDDGQGE